MRFLLCVLAAMLCQAVTMAEPVNISVDLAGKPRPVSPHLWGIFYEDINHAADGGLYAELVRNRNFEDGALAPGCTVDGDQLVNPNGWRMSLRDCADPLTGWSLVQSAESRASLEISQEDPPFASAPRYARWTIEAIGQGVALVNDGFWGVPVKTGATYRLSLWVNADDYTGGLTVTIGPAGGGEPYAIRKLAAARKGWQAVEATLTSSATDARARLRIHADTPGTLCFDSVSLMPEDTWKGRHPGLRPDIAQMLADLKPSFIRFPGGCIVEGFTLETAWHWEETLGPWQARPGRHNLWGYRSSEGLGLHELLQFAEDLGAAPMLILNCGMSCQGRHPTFAPMGELEPWVEKVLNALEYATGSTESKWGKRRVEHGHPAPFKVPYFGIGNENWGPEYHARYAVFYEALKGRYPDMEIIACQPVPDAPMDIVDEHFYCPPAWFMRSSRLYDKRSRDGARILVGEYAANQRAGRGNLKAAVGEAAFLIGLERNADLVVMAAYAPLLQRAEDRAWPVNLIVFDNDTVYGTPSYYAQRLFSHHRPTETYAVDIEIDSEPRYASGTKVGLGVLVTSAEYRNVRLETAQGEIELAADTFQKDHGGPWETESNLVRQASSDGMHLGFFETPSEGDFTLRLQGRKLEGKEGFKIPFRAESEFNFIWLSLGGWDNVAHGVERTIDGVRETIGEHTKGSIESGRWYDIVIAVEGRRIRCSLDGETVVDMVEPPFDHLDVEAGLGYDERSGDYIAKLVNFSGETRAVTLRLNNTEHPAFDVNGEVLTSDGPLDENTLEAPNNVVPHPVRPQQAVPVDALGWSCPPWSLTVLRLTPVS